MKDMFLTVGKFIAAIFLLPVVMAITYAFQIQISALDPGIRQALFVGMMSYIIMHFFIYNFSAVYVFGQTMVAAIFGFFKPLVKVAPYILPIYTLAVIVIYGILSLMGKMGSEGLHMLLFWAAFTFSMHIVLTAQDLYNKDSTAGKPNYFFGMTLVYILDVFLMAFFMNMIISSFAFADFFLAITDTAYNIFKTVLQQLF